ncbi:MAG TPA: hypothetical protein VNY08_14595 [Bradyrhizobium sp.]|jgi:hypothetical protein|nr:hypothetical protein [Bradyrhizobium sp.]
MKRLLTTIAVLATASSVGLARADTLYADFSPVFADGEMHACNIEYAAFFDDFTYEQGRRLVATGSLYLTIVKGMPASMVKVRLGTLANNHFDPVMAPTSVSFLNAGHIVRPVTSADSDVPGARVSVYGTDVTVDLLEQILGGKITLSFARKKGGLDILLPLDIQARINPQTGERTLSKVAINAFSLCAYDLIEKAKKQ